MKYFAAFAMLFLLASCGPEDLPNIQPIDFAGAPPISLNVATIQVVDEYVPPMALPNVEHAAPTPPYRAVRTWADERLRAAGPGGYLRVGIKDAHIVQKQLIGQTEYDGRIDVALDASSADGQTTGTAEIVVQRKVVVDNDKNLAEKETIWDNLTRQMMADFDKSASGAIAQNLSRFAVR